MRIEKQVLPKLRTLKARERFIELLRSAFQKDVTGLSEQLRSGALSLGDWQKAMKMHIKRLHINCAVAARGGEWSAMTQADWGKVGAQVKKQYRWLGRFSQDIADKVAAGWDPTTAIDARARLYAASGHDTYYKILGQVGQWVRWVTMSGNPCGDCLQLESLGWMPADSLWTAPGGGETVCDGNCKCQLLFGNSRE